MEWLGPVMQKALTWAKFDTNPCHHMAPPGHNALKNNNIYFFLLDVIKNTYPKLMGNLAKPATESME